MCVFVVYTVIIVFIVFNILLYSNDNAYLYLRTSIPIGLFWSLYPLAIDTSVFTTERICNRVPGGGGGSR